MTEKKYTAKHDVINPADPTQRTTVEWADGIRYFKITLIWGVEIECCAQRVHYSDPIDEAAANAVLKELGQDSYTDIMDAVEADDAEDYALEELGR
jgi:hypothetical protein